MAHAVGGAILIKEYHKRKSGMDIEPDEMKEMLKQSDVKVFDMMTLGEYPRLDLMKALSYDTSSPNINLITENNSNLASGQITLEYNVTDATGIQECTLFIDNVANLSDSNVEMSINQNFILDLSEGTYTWKVFCIDNSSNNNNATSIEYSLNVISDSFDENLCGFAKDTWNYFAASTSSTAASSCYDCTVYGHALPRGSKKLGDNGAGYNANSADFGLYLGGIVNAYELGFMSMSEAAGKIKETLNKLIELQESSTTSSEGLFLQYYIVTGASVTVADNTVPSAENAWLAANLITVEQFAKEKGLINIEQKAEQLLSNMNFSQLFNDGKWSSNEAERNVFVHRLNKDMDSCVGACYFYNIYSEEGRLVGFISRVLDRRYPGHGINSSQVSDLLGSDGMHHAGLGESQSYGSYSVNPVGYTSAYFTYGGPAIYMKEK
jgi:hypothetical protein